MTSKPLAEEDTTLLTEHLLEIQGRAFREAAERIMPDPEEALLRACERRAQEEPRAYSLRLFVGEANERWLVVAPSGEGFSYHCLNFYSGNPSYWERPKLDRIGARNTIARAIGREAIKDAECANCFDRNCTRHSGGQS